MDMTATLDQIRGMPMNERLRLAQAIWEEIEADGGPPIPLTPAQDRELARRIADDRIHPESIVPWEQVKADAMARARQ